MSKTIEQASRRGLAATVANKVFFERKTLQKVLEEGKHDHEGGAGKLGLLDLLAIGIGSTIGSGVFVLTGKAFEQAGGGAVIGWLIAGVVCSLSSFSYMELSVRLPTKGSCYMFSYHALGELASVVGAVCLTMEYAVASAGVARTWSVKLAKATGTLEAALLCYDGSDFGGETCNSDTDTYFDPIAGCLMLLCTIVVACGLDLGKVIINTATMAKLCLVLFMIVAGLLCWTGGNFSSPEAFFPQGAGGLVKVTPLLFWGFIGFDEVCCMASKAADPVKTMPYAMGGTLLAAAVISALAQLALTSMVVYQPGSGGVSFEGAFASHSLAWIRWVVSVGELALLPLVTFLCLLPQPEVTAAMSEDRLLPSIFRKRNRQGTFVRGSLIVGCVATVIAMTVPFEILGQVISIGVLFSFNLTNLSLISLRYGNGGALRVPAVDALVWVLMVAMAIAGYCCQQGLVERSLAGMPLSMPALGGFVAASVIGVSILLLLTFKFEQRCDMSDPSIYKARGVPFIPAFAIFCNFFLAASFPWMNVAFFAAFLAVFLVTYLVYLLRAARTCSIEPVAADCDTDSTTAGSEVPSENESRTQSGVYLDTL